MTNAFRCAIWTIVAVLLVAPPVIGSRQGEALFEARALKDCASKQVRPTIGKQIEEKLRVEFQRVNPKIDNVTIVDIRCARTRDGIPMGAVILGYGRVADIRKAYDEFQTTHDIYSLLANEQFGVFQYSTSLARHIKTIKIIRSERWLDYSASIELTPANKLILRSKGATYGDLAHQEQFDVAW